jgi:hypothetical protein
MATTAGAYGLRPLNLLGGTPFSGATRQYPIASNYALNIFNGSVVKIVGTGGVELDTTAAGLFTKDTIGVFLGCQYTDPNTKQLLFSQNYPANTVADDILAFVVDDPNTLFTIQANGAIPLDARGANVILANAQSTTTGSLITGNSDVAASSGVTLAATAPLRIVDFVTDAQNSPGDAFTEIVVKINPAFHSFTNTGAGV